MARSIWKGSIAFGLVQIPVALQSAEEPDELSFHMLDKRDLAPIGFERVNKRTGKKVDWNQIVKGYQHSNGKFVVLTDADFEEANIEATHTIDIERFVDLADLDPMYFERPYYVVPDKQGQKPYALLLETLEKSGKVAVARIVIRTRQHLAALMPRGDLLVLMLLRFDHELRKPSDLDLPEGTKKIGITAKERDMAKHLVDSMLGEWEPAKYKDEYRDDLMAMIRERVKRGEVNTIPEKAPKKRAAKRSAEIIDLVQLLKQSVEEKSATPKHHAKKTAGKGGPRKTRKHTERHLKKSA